MRTETYWGRARRQWSKAPIWFFGGCLLMALAPCIVGIPLLMMGARLPPTPLRTGPLTVKQSEVIAYRTGDTSAVLRCAMCEGTGWRRRGFGPERERCSFCAGRGAQRVTLKEPLRIVPD
jgi:hypothetical protein